MIPPHRVPSCLQVLDVFVGRCGLGRSVRAGCLAALGFRAGFRARFRAAPHGTSWLRAGRSPSPRAVFQCVRPPGSSCHMLRPRAFQRHVCPEACSAAPLRFPVSFGVLGFGASARIPRWLPRCFRAERCWAASFFLVAPALGFCPRITFPQLPRGSKAGLRAARAWGLQSELRTNEGCTNSKGRV